MDIDDDDPAAVIQAAIDEHGFLSFLGTRVDGVGDGWTTLTVPYDDALANHGPSNDGEMHGGVAATLVDTAGGLACRTELEDPTGAGVATIDLNVSYLRAALGDLQARAETVRVGRTVGVAEVTVESETPEEGVAPVATGRGSYRVFRD